MLTLLPLKSFICPAQAPPPGRPCLTLQRLPRVALQSAGTLLPSSSTLGPGASGSGQRPAQWQEENRRGQHGAAFVLPILGRDLVCRLAVEGEDCVVLAYPLLGRPKDTEPQSPEWEACSRFSRPPPHTHTATLGNRHSATSLCVGNLLGGSPWPHTGSCGPRWGGRGPPVVWSAAALWEEPPRSCRGCQPGEALAGCLPCPYGLYSLLPGRLLFQTCAWRSDMLQG